MRYCVFSTVIKTIISHLQDDCEFSQKNVLMDIFESFYKCHHNFSFDSSLISRWVNGKAALSPDIKQYYFNEIGSMTKNELKALFAKKGLTEDKGYGVWTKEEVAAALKDNTFTVILKPDARYVTKDGTEVLNEASSAAELLKYDDYNTVQANYLDFATKLPRDEISLLFSRKNSNHLQNDSIDKIYTTHK